MKATITTRKPKFTPSHRKERGGFITEISALTANPFGGREAKAIVTLRIYQPGSVAYACVWINGHEFDSSGTGSAGGGGYCKHSAAAGEAIRNAGFDLSEDIHGRGMSTVREAVLALAEAVGYPEAMLHTAHA